jgi:hypothetical protein
MDLATTKRAILYVVVVAAALLASFPVASLAYRRLRVQQPLVLPQAR